MHRFSELRRSAADSPDDDIEIRIVGVRPGAKLYEELLIDGGGLLPTPHEKILRASERMLAPTEMAAIFEDLRAVLARDRFAVRHVLETSLGADRLAPLGAFHLGGGVSAAATPPVLRRQCSKAAQLPHIRGRRCATAARRA